MTLEERIDDFLADTDNERLDFVFTSEPIGKVRAKLYRVGHIVRLDLDPSDMTAENPA